MLDNFLQTGGTGGTAGSFTCPTQAASSLTDEVAVGYQASSSCYGITNFKVRTITTFMCFANNLFGFIPWRLLKDNLEGQFAPEIRKSQKDV